MKHRFIAKRYWNDVPNAFSEVRATAIGDLIHLTYGDPDFTTSEKILGPAFDDIRNGHTHYDELCGYTELRDLIAGSLEEDYGLKTERENVYVTNGAGHGLLLALESILDDGDEVIIHEPFYSPYPEQVVMARGVPVFVATYEEDGFELKAEDLEKKITNRTKALIINNPNNPTGATFSRKSLEGIADVAKKHDLVVICDAAYTSLNYDEPYTPIAALEGMGERTVTLFSASKEYAMSGWRVGFNHAPEFLVHRMQRVNENDSIMASSIAQRAYIHAIKNRKEIRRELADIFKERVEYAYGRISAMNKIHALPPHATFYLFPNIKDTGLSSREVADRLFETTHVAVFAGSFFGDSGEGYLRISCTQNMDVLKDAFDRIDGTGIFG
ncbi:MAG: aminotransferase class I/II-fold pyridoxal phosphate-dependent enzyme [Clostridiales Family XIII bacterium]|jgi:aspartate/methionine/tyrosine aminotransferase|nr:aminotransferase class I/II-fold pyridoxal phosphate-dependent enzyme [Clostridiales Family XIII bacterium]